MQSTGQALSGLMGLGVKVGVISNGVGVWTSARANGDLRANIQTNVNLGRGAPASACPHRRPGD